MSGRGPLLGETKGPAVQAGVYTPALASMIQDFGSWFEPDRLAIPLDRPDAIYIDI